MTMTTTTTTTTAMTMTLMMFKTKLFLIVVMMVAISNSLNATVYGVHAHAIQQERDDRDRQLKSKYVKHEHHEQHEKHTHHSKKELQKSSKKSSKKSPFVPPSPSSPYLMEATKIASKVIDQINNDNNDPKVKGVLAHGFYGMSGSKEIIDWYMNGNSSNGEKKIDWNNGDVITDSAALGFGRPYSSSWSLYSHGLKPIAFNAYRDNVAVPGLLMGLDKNSHIDVANYLTSPVDCDTLQRQSNLVSAADDALNKDITIQKNKGGTYKGFYKCNIDCSMNSDGLCMGTAPAGSVGNGDGTDWSGKDISLDPFVTADAEPKAYVGSDGTGWMNMFVYNWPLDQGLTDGICTFVREDDLTGTPSNDSQEVFDAFRKTTVEFQHYIATRIPCCSTCSCPEEDRFNNPFFYLETEVALNMDKLTNPGMKIDPAAPPGAPNKDRSPIAFGDDMMSVSINTRTCKQYHEEYEGEVCTDGKVAQNWPAGTPFDNASEQKTIVEVKVAGCYVSLQLSQDFGRFVPVIEANVLSVNLTPGNIRQWSDPKWDDASNYMKAFDCCKIANRPENSDMKARYDSSGLAEFKC